MRRPLAFAFFFALLTFSSASTAFADSPASAGRKAYVVRVAILGAIATIELLLILSLFRSWSKSRAAEAALQRKEEQLRKSEEMFSKVFRQGPTAITLTSATTQRFIDVNETYEQLSGFRREEVIGRSVQEIGLWSDPDERTRLLGKILAEHRLRNFEFRFRRKDGTRRIGLASAELIEVAGEQCVLGVASDITDRKEAEHALAESEKRLRLIADSAPVLMWVTDSDDQCTDVNERWQKLTGRSKEEALRRGWQQSIHPQDLALYLRTKQDAIAGRQSFTSEYRMRRFDGEYRWMRTNAVPRFLENGEFAGYIGCCVDFTEEEEAKAARAEFSGRLIRAQEKERTRIARELHDDINQRLALLANGVERVIQVNGGLSKAEQAAELRELWQLTNEIATDVQQLSHQLHPSKLHYLGLGTAVRELCQEYSRQHRIGVEYNVLGLTADLDEDVSLSLFRTVQESLRNVAKHSQASEANVELIQDAGIITLRVSDNGTGFDVDRPQNPLGLGLVSMGERLRSVGGHFRIVSSLGHGTQIEGTVPVVLKRNRSRYQPVE